MIGNPYKAANKSDIDENMSKSPQQDIKGRSTTISAYSKSHTDQKQKVIKASHNLSTSISFAKNDSSKKHNNK